MSMIKTANGWVELGAANPLERAYETAGWRAESIAMLHVPDVKQTKRMTRETWLTLMPQREMVIFGWAVEQIREWNVSLAQKAGVHCEIAPDGKATFGHYGPKWTI